MRTIGVCLVLAQADFSQAGRGGDGVWQNVDRMVRINHF